MDNYLGEIRMFGGNYAPANWAFCNGQGLSISQYSALYALIGTAYGGDGVQTFNLPNLQSSVAVGQGNGQGLTPRVVGQTGGTETVTLTTQQIPQHNHLLAASTATAIAATPANTLIPGTPKVATGTPHFYTLNDGSSPPPVPLTLVGPSCGQAGGNLPHPNLMPFLCVSFIIALQGVFPTRQ